MLGDDQIAFLFFGLGSLAAAAVGYLLDLTALEFVVFVAVTTWAMGFELGFMVFAAGLCLVYYCGVCCRCTTESQSRRRWNPRQHSE